MSMLLRAAAAGLAGIFLVAAGCGGDDGDDTKTEDDSETETDESPVSGMNDTAGGSGGELRTSCLEFCDAQAECLGLSDASCRADCDTQVEMLVEFDCATEGAAENRCMTKLSCDDLKVYASQGRRANEACGAAARDYFDACTAGESAECTAMCDHYATCDALATPASACEESCLLRQASLDFSGGQKCGDRFIEFVSCLAEASCEDVGAMTSAGTTPPSCAGAEQALNEACG